MVEDDGGIVQVASGKHFWRIFIHRRFVEMSVSMISCAESTGNTRILPHVGNVSNPFIVEGGG